MKPHPSTPSPGEKERYFIAKPNNSNYHISSFKSISIFESLGCVLMASSFGGGREEVLLLWNAA
jgi:hypothetical protein